MATALPSLFPPTTFFEHGGHLASRSTVREARANATALEAAGVMLRVPQLPVVSAVDSWTRAESAVIPQCCLPVGLIVSSLILNLPLNSISGQISRLVNELGQAALKENLPRQEVFFEQCLTMQCGRVHAPAKLAKKSPPSPWC